MTWATAIVASMVIRLAFEVGRRLAVAPPYNQLSYMESLIVMGAAATLLEFGGV
jgi:hypothetical protein